MRVVILLMVFLTSAAHAEGLELRGVKLGDSQAAVVAAHPGYGFDCFDFDATERIKRSCRVGKVVDRGHGLGTTIYVEDFGVFLNAEGNIEQVTKKIDPFELDSFADALIAKFGPPDSDDLSEITNRMGAAFDQRELVWRRGDSELRAEKRSGKVTEGAIVLSRILSPEELQREKDARAQKAAADI